MRLAGWCGTVHDAREFDDQANKKTASFAVTRETPLYELHRELGAKMIEFAGYSMPLNYPSGILKEHAHVRDAAGLFDVSHMGQLRLAGADAAALLERLVPTDIIGLPENRQTYTLFTNEGGGILDDLMVINAGKELILVVNANRVDADVVYLEEHLGDDGVLELQKRRALIALQGPAAGEVMAGLAPETSGMRFMDAGPVEVAGISCFATRSGYTGEDGFEISLPADRAVDLARELLAHEAVEPAGLGARDTLRLEAGLCLYGKDIDEDTTPVEAGLRWTISPSRRPGGERAGGYPGDQIIAEQLKDGVSRRRVGIRPEGRAPVRDGTKLVDKHGGEVGMITSGAYGATVGGPVAMAYLSEECAAPETKLDALVRGKPQPVRVARLPFVKQRYHRD
ncbi:MAG: glycine cleavage system aminomethyltransferase GcvT [Gammaproteobacteria bacterium]|nr:glycine cleavage system aminomethyltransferase GcvT [Gammaproteobacteria bacterium]